MISVYSLDGLGEKRLPVCKKSSRLLILGRRAFLSDGLDGKKILIGRRIYSLVALARRDLSLGEKVLV